MKNFILLKVIFLIIVLCISGSSVAQEQFTQFTYFDQIQWSPDGNQIAFRCVLLDESRPDMVRSNMLVKDIAGDQITCINPQAERFVISADKKRLLFAGIYGLYLMNLDKNGAAVQLYFRDPAATWLFQDFGFYEDTENIFINRINPFEGETFEENFKLQPIQTTEKMVRAASLEKLNKKVNSNISNLKAESITGSRIKELKLGDSVLQFLPVENSRSEFNLVILPDGKRSSSKNLLENCRPRILSISPDEKSAIVSVFSENINSTYLYSRGTNKFTKINDEQMLSISWLNSTKYICITEKGLFLRELNLSLNQKLDEFELPDWCKSMELQLPAYELQVGFENEKSKAETVLSKLNRIGFDGRLIYHKNRFQSGYRIRVGGFVSKSDALAEGEKLKQNGYEFWVDKISNMYDFLNRSHVDEAVSFGNKKALVQYKMNDYLRSRIVLENGGQQILVPEMNNIQGRTAWE